MQPQHVAPHCSSNGSPDAPATQIRASEPCGYLFDTISRNYGARKSQGFLTSVPRSRARVASKGHFLSDRRLRCQRASNYWQHSALSLLLLPVRASSRSKNLSWLIQSRSRLSRHTPVNTSKTGLTGRAFAPTPTASLIKGSAAC
ncbi:MAG: hypothetical protein ACI9PY_000971 [Ascidiaceihabitans sp.]|jgi:hypothetical protein